MEKTHPIYTGVTKKVFFAGREHYELRFFSAGYKL